MKAIVRIVALIFLCGGLAACSLDSKEERITIQVANHRSGAIEVDSGLLGIEVPGGASRAVGLVRGDTLTADDKATGNYVSSRSFYSDGDTWDVY